MNFFEQQDKARKQSRWLIAAFLGVTLLIIVVINVIVQLVTGGGHLPLTTTVGGYEQVEIASLFSLESLLSNSKLLIISSLITASIIGLSSLVKIASLRSGGAKVAADLGGTLVTADTRDPLRRRLYNVVEEISIASGTPVPEVFVLEAEPGINAFAAGYSAADAAVAVTQGTLERLTRSELQGVIAHEFSHIFNGDMRLNIRLMGVIFGIMVLAVIGRKFMHSMRYSRSSRNKDAGAVIAVGAALMLVGYVGLFFARWMKSALSRQREYLADASAVQYTRDPDGIAGALKKIAAYNHSSYLKTDSEEVSHMLFGSGYRSLMFATHPPIEQRIQRIEKGFNAKEIDQLANKLKQQERREHSQAVQAAKELVTANSHKRQDFLFDVDDIISNIGNPSTGRIVAASLLTNSLEERLKHAAHSTEWSPEVLMYCLLDPDENLREKQLLIVMQEMGDLSEGKIRHLITNNGLIAVDHRLPLMEIAYPSLKRRPISDIERLLDTIDKMSRVDNKIDSFEYLLSRLIKQYMHESYIPNKTRLHGRKKVKDCIEELATVVSILASHGQNSTSSQGLQLAQKAFTAGMSSVGINHKNLAFKGDWQDRLDKALSKLDRLSAKEKAHVVRALATTVLDDKKMITEEQEMMRVICALIHVPLPMLQSAA